MGAWATRDTVHGILFSLERNLCLCLSDQQRLLSQVDEAEDIDSQVDAEDIDTMISDIFPPNDGDSLVT